MVPVSSASGIGEYMVCLILADALRARWPGLDIQFLLSREAPVASSCPYPARLLDRSPTLAGSAVDRALQALRPDLVLFGGAGRAGHARLAARLGARVIYISQHRRKRAKGFALPRLVALDAHWITQFRFVDGDLSWSERLKLRLLRKPEPVFLGPLHAVPATTLPAAFAGLGGRRYSVWAAGGGGHRAGDRSATEVFHAAARRLAGPDTPAVVIAGANYAGPPLAEHPSLQVLSRLPHPELMTLVSQAALTVCGGGDLMGQALAMGRNVLAVAVAKDQPRRMAACAARGLIRTAPLSESDLAAAARVAQDDPLHPKLDEAGGLPRALAEIERLLGLAR